MNLALGLIETKGLVGALEAADAMAKAASIKIIGKEKVTAGLMVIKIEGEVAAVKSAVDAGSVAAQRVGQLVSAHVIPRPAEQIDSVLIKNISPSSKTEKVADEESFVKPIVKKIEQKKTKIENIISVKKTVVKTDPKNTKKLVIKKQAKPQTSKVSKRTVVKSTSGKKTSTKTQTLSELETLNVHALRKLARSSSNFPIKGRDISKANRGKLLDYFKKIK